MLPKTSEYYRLKIIPNSSKNSFAGQIEDENGITYRIKINAAPEKGKANKELIKFLSKSLGIAKSKIAIINGETSQIKLIKIAWN